MAEKKETRSKAVESVCQSNIAFNGRVYPALVEGNGSDTNLIASLFSINSALSMTLLGARGSTKDQMKKALSVPDEEEQLMHDGYKEIVSVLKTDEDVTLDVANRLFVNKTFPVLPEFLEATKTSYEAEAESMDFANGGQAASLINKWIEEKTHDKIKNMVSGGSIDDRTKMVLVNAIYFKGVWQHWFDSGKTKDEDFFVTKDNPVTVKMMHQKDSFRCIAHKELACHILEMPYRGKHPISMLLFLPDKPDDFAEMESKFGNVDLSALEWSRWNKWTIAVPRFRVETTHDLGAPLSKLGLRDVFDPSAADLTGISEQKGLFVSQMVQKAFIEVDEYGSEAGAVTLMKFTNLSLVLGPKLEFICNRPFLFAIQDSTTGIILFHGRVMNPNA